MDDSISPSSGRRRRRRGRTSRAGIVGIASYLRGEAFARHLFLAMAGLAVVYCGAVLLRTRQATFQFGAATLGMSRAEVRYLLGEPAAVDAQDRTWSYQDNGRRMHAGFGADGRLREIGCSAGGVARFACPQVLGLRVGDTEDKVWRQLGRPSREIYRGTDKTIRYDGLGLEFQLSRLTVTGMQLREGGNIAGYLPRAMWAMLP